MPPYNDARQGVPSATLGPIADLPKDVVVGTLAYGDEDRTRSRRPYGFVEQAEERVGERRGLHPYWAAGAMDQERDVPGGGGLARARADLP
jgi:hypothetical protein